MRRALLRAGHDEDEVSSALERLRSERLLDDRRFAQVFATSRIAHFGLGRRRIEQALKHKGVERQDVAQGLEVALREVSEAEAMDSLARRRWRSWKEEEPERRLRHLFRFLLGRGFPPALVRDRLKALFPRQRDLVEDLEPVTAEEME